MSNPSRLSTATREQFLTVLADTANVTEASNAVGVSRVAMYAHRDKDPEFAAQWDEAVKVGTEMLKDEAARRATGFDEVLTFKGQVQYEYERDPDTGQIIIDELIVDAPVMDMFGNLQLDEEGEIKHAKQLRKVPRLKVHNGRPVPQTIKRYSDPILLALLAARDPANFRSNHKVELTGKDDGPVQFEDTERTARLASVLARLEAKRAQTEKQAAAEDDGSDLV